MPLLLNLDVEVLVRDEAEGNMIVGRVADVLCNKQDDEGNLLQYDPAEKCNNTFNIRVRQLVYNPPAPAGIDAVEEFVPGDAESESNE